MFYFVHIHAYNIILQVFLSLAVVLERPGLGGPEHHLKKCESFFVAGDILWEKGEKRAYVWTLVFVGILLAYCNPSTSAYIWRF